MGKLATVTISAPTVLSEEMAFLLGLITAVPVIVVMAAIGPEESISNSLMAARMKTNLALPFGAPARSILAGARSNFG